MFQNNAAYELVHQAGKYRVYTPVNFQDGYHMSRYVEAINQQIYSNAGATRDVLESIMDEILARCNKELHPDNFRTDIAALANNIKYRLKYPVDQHCAIRMGAILSFMEYEAQDGATISEQPDKMEFHWLQKKVQLAMDMPELYSFFLTWGISNTPRYREALDTSNEADFFLKRDETLRSLMPQVRSSQ